MPAADPARAHRPTRRTPVALLALAAALLVLRVAVGVWEARRAGPAGGDRVGWVPIEQAEARARAEGKPLLYDFSAAWCGPCRAMERDVFADAEAAQRIDRRFVPVRVVDRRREDGRNARAVDSLQQVYRVDGFPTLVVAWPGGVAHESMSGYRGGALTLQWLASAETKVRARAGATMMPGVPATPAPAR